jgi:cytochrome P450
MAVTETGTYTDPSRLADPALHEQGGATAILARLRREAPVCWVGGDGDEGFWVVSRYREVTEVLRDPRTFSSEQGMALDANPAAVQGARHKMLIVTDPPRHGKIRKLVNAVFTPRTVARIEQNMHRTVRSLLDQALSEGECDLVKLAARLPVSVICDLLGVPEPDWDFMLDRTQTAFGEALDADPLARAQAHADILGYYALLAKERRQCPADDLVSALVHGQVDGKPLTDEEVFLNCDGLVSGGNETTRHATAGGILALIDHPGEWRRLRDDPGLLGSAVQEILRWTSPAMHAKRTPVRDVRLGGQTVRAGQAVTVWMPSANRDPDVFPDPDVFDLGRAPNKHVTFGVGEHYCLGSALAQTELTVFFSEFIAAVGSAERAGPVSRLRSSLIQGYRSVPATVRPDPGYRGEVR